MLLVLGPVIGSFLGVLVRRLPEGRPVVAARSACETCGHVLGPLEMVPLLSFALQRGRCKACGAPISWFHPAIELAALAIAAAALLADGDSGRAWIDSALGWTLLGAAWIDARSHRLPDVFTLPLVLAGLAVTGAEQPDALSTHAAAAALAYLAFVGLNAAYKRLRGRDGLGMGDAKLLAAAGAWLGLAALPNLVTLAALLTIALILARRHRADAPIAFGPALALAFFGLRLLG